MKYDLIIIGAGPAGLTAGLYAVRSGLKVAIISKDIGGTTNSILLLENWPGFKGAGTLLMKQFYDQLKEYDVDFIMDDVENIKKNSSEFLLKTKKSKYESKTVIIATGTKRRKLNIPGEQDFIGKGVSYCVTCDAFFFKNKVVGVIGGSDCAAVSALALTDLAKKVYVIYRGEKLRCENVSLEKLEEKENVELIYNAVPKKLIGKNKLDSLELDIKGKKRNVELDGIFIEIGSVPLAKFAKELNLKLDEKGYIVVDENMNTSVKGLFGAGDITNQKLKQVVVASGQGSIAAKNAYEFLKTLKN
jgi:thioredoxin reductase (NADPH)